MTINDISNIVDNRKENIKQYLNDIGLSVVDENDKLIRIKNKDISTYMNIYWEDIFNISNSSNIDLSLSYNYLKSNCYIDNVFFL
jgi:hypothetical protein